jgi:hypothetical protein
MNPSLATALAQATQGLDDAARLAKRSEAASRRQARELRRTLDELRGICDELGINLTTQPRRAQP